MQTNPVMVADAGLQAFPPNMSAGDNINVNPTNFILGYMGVPQYFVPPAPTFQPQELDPYTNQQSELSQPSEYVQMLTQEFTQGSHYTQGHSQGYNEYTLLASQDLIQGSEYIQAPSQFMAQQQTCMTVAPEFTHSTNYGQVLSQDNSSGYYQCFPQQGHGALDLSQFIAQETLAGAVPEYNAQLSQADVSQSVILEQCEHMSTSDHGYCLSQGQESDVYSVILTQSEAQGLQVSKTEFQAISDNIDCGVAIEQNAAVYPMVYVSPAGLLTVLLRHDVAVEMTADKTLRVVNHAHQAVAATSARGNSACIFHAAAKIFQQGTEVEADIYGDRRIKLTPQKLTFAAGPECCDLLPDTGLVYAHNPEFSDLTRDMSVSLLFSATGYGPHMISFYEDVAKKSKYVFHKNGAVSVHVNGVKIYQNKRGDVSVRSWPKFIRVSPVTGAMFIDTHFVEMAIEPNWNVRVKRGEHRLLANHWGISLSDDILECGCDQSFQVYVHPVMYYVRTIIDKAIGLNYTPPPVDREDEKQDNTVNKQEYAQKFPRNKRRSQGAYMKNNYPSNSSSSVSTN